MDFNRILRNILIGGIFLIPFIPIIVANNMFFPFITGKNFTFRIITELLFGTWILLALRDVRYRPNFSWILVTLAAFVAIIAIADLHGANVHKSLWSNYERMEGLVTLIHLLAYTIVAGTVLKTDKLWMYFLHTSIGISLFSIMFGVIQLDGLTMINQGGVRLDAKFGNATYLAIYMLFHIFISAIYLFRRLDTIKPLAVSVFVGFGTFLLNTITLFPKGLPDGAAKYVWISVIGMGIMVYLLFQEGKGYMRAYVIPALYVAFMLGQAVILYFTATRGAILGLFVGAIVAGVMIALFEKERKKLRLAGVSMLVAVVVVVGLFLSVKDMDFVRESPVLRRFANISLQSGDVQTRFTIWSMAWEGVKERPILGWGQENFNLVFNKYYSPTLYNDEPWFDRTHDVIFDWLIAGGILGLLGYASIVLAFLYCLWFRKSEHLTVVDKSLLTGVLAGYMFHNLFVFDNITSYIVYMGLLAFVYAMTTPDLEKGKFAMQFDIGVVNRILTPVVIIAMVFTVYAVNTKSILASSTLIEAIRAQTDPQKNIDFFKEALEYNGLGDQEIREQIVQAATRAAQAQNVEPGVKQQIYELARSEMLKQREEAPDDARHALFMGTLYEAFGQHELAHEQIQDAQKLSPNKQTIRFALASNLINLGRSEEAFKLLEETLALEPKFSEAQVMYAVGAIYAGKREEADKILMEHFGTTIVDNNRLLQAYINAGDWEAVRDIWELRVEKKPNNAQYRLSLAASYLQIGEREKAIEAINKVIELDPKFKEQGEFLIQEIRAGRNPQ